MRRLNFDIPFKSIFATGMNPELGELPIYHVHGFLPQKGKLSKANQVTLGEAIYHEQYTNTYSWNNLVQINKFRKNNCLFIGSSLTNPNIRRLLDIAKQQKSSEDSNHFTFRRRYDENYVRDQLRYALDKNNKLLNEKSISSLSFEETSKLLIQIIEKFEENDGLSLGVNTIWIESYEEIPKILAEIRKNTIGNNT